MDNHLTDHQLYAKLKMQSAYRKYHSTESALLKVFNDINTAIDNQHECVLVLLDLSAAFDNIDHKILINRLENKYGISGLALEWLKSYLREWPQRVIVNGTYSDPKLFRRSPRFCTWAPIVFIVLWSTGRCDKSSWHRYDDVCWWLPALYHNKTEQSSCFLRSAWTLHWWCSTSVSYTHLTLPTKA